MKYIILISLLVSACASYSLEYYDRVLITSGRYKGKTGILLGDCGGFELYSVRVEDYVIACIRSWDMKKINSKIIE